MVGLVSWDHRWADNNWVQHATLDLIPFENYILMFCLFEIGGPNENDGLTSNIKETESAAEENNGKYL